MMRHCVQTAVSALDQLKADGVGELLTLGKQQAKLPLCYNKALTQFFLVPNICAL